MGKSFLNNFNFIVYNLLFATYFYFFNKPLAKFTYEVFYEESSNEVLLYAVLGAVFLESLGLLLKLPALQQTFALEKQEIGDKVNAPIWLLSLLNIWIGLGALGRLPMGAFLGILAAGAATGHSLKSSGGAWELFFGEELIRAFVVLFLIFWYGMSTVPKTKIDQDNPPIYFMIKDFLGDICLGLFACLSFSMIWTLVISGPKLEKIDPFDIYNTFWGIVLFALLYMPSNMVHFLLHTANLAKENTFQRWLYWISWIITLIMALAPMYKEW